MSRRTTIPLLLVLGLLALTVGAFAHGQVESRAYALVCGLDAESARYFCEGHASAEITVQLGRSLEEREWTPDPQRIIDEFELRCWLLEPRRPGADPEVACRGSGADD